MTVRTTEHRSLVLLPHKRVGNWLNSRNWVIRTLGRRILIEESILSVVITGFDSPGPFIRSHIVIRFYFQTSASIFRDFVHILCVDRPSLRLFGFEDGHFRLDFKNFTSAHGWLLIPDHHCKLRMSKKGVCIMANRCRCHGRTYTLTFTSLLTSVKATILMMQVLRCRIQHGQVFGSQFCFL